MEGTRKDPVAQFQEILAAAVSVQATDVHLKVGLPPVVRYKDELRVLSKVKGSIKREELENIVMKILPEAARGKFIAGQEVDAAYSYSGVGRFRLNIFRHRGSPSIVARFIPFDPKSIEELHLPEILKSLALKRKGLILVTGTAGSGKSTTVAAMLQEWNKSRSGHIITVEDPIEYLIRDKKALLTQREVGMDTADFATGIKNALRQDPDVLMIGELRDKEAIREALSAAETGHLVISTLHTRDAVETVSRIVGVFAPEVRDQIRWQLSAVLEAVICQKLLPVRSKNFPSKILPVAEVLVSTARVQQIISQQDRHGELFDVIEKGAHYGMQSFDQALLDFHERGILGRDQIMEHASRPSDLELKLRGISGSSTSRAQPSTESRTGLSSLTVEPGAGSSGIELEGRKPK